MAESAAHQCTDHNISGVKWLEARFWCQWANEKRPFLTSIFIQLSLADTHADHCSRRALIEPASGRKSCGIGRFMIPLQTLLLQKTFAVYSSFKANLSLLKCTRV
jgi:hypothetical protein